MGSVEHTSRVVIVDDDDINRAGLAAVLDTHPAIEVSASYNHDEALGENSIWCTIDTVLIDAADARRADDQFPGVGVVEHVRRTAGRQPTVVVVTGHFFNDAVRRRMREARADFFYHRSEVSAACALHAAVLTPRGQIPEADQPEAEFRHGVNRTTRVNQAVRYALDRQLPARLVEREAPRSRSWDRLRREFNGEARLGVVTSDGRQPDRNQDTPSLRQIARFLAWATRIDRGTGAVENTSSRSAP